VIAVLQRVGAARVEVAGQVVGEIGPGLLVLVCAEPTDTPATAAKMLDKWLKLRVFSDAAGKMNRSLQDLDGAGTPGGLLIVSQSTLAADTAGGNRPSFSGAAPAAQGRALYDALVALARERHTGPVASGAFGADMQVHLVNDGPVTIPMRGA
jgi:D-aminoacyl-tRNA deacylase